jgi:uncharacterized protein YecE (DUF72 family)
MTSMGSVLVGTSGYSYRDWVGPVYPQGTSQRDFLSFYASEFNMVELNFSFYAQPRPMVLESMLGRVGEDFQFAIKGHRSLTHEKAGSRREEATRFRTGISPLVDASRLAAVLLQFPYSFHYTPSSRKHLDHVCRLLEGLPVAVEFRNSEWQRDSVIHELEERQVGFVNVDEPELPRLPKPSETVTADVCYLRFHGRNRKNWWQGDNNSRYDYLYSETELKDWLVRIINMMKKSRLLIIAFNNHFRGQAVRNARQLKSLLELP